MGKKLGQEPAFADPMRGAEQSPLNQDTEKLPVGMSKRFYAACAVLQGFASDPGVIGSIEDITKAAYFWADELLKQENE